MERERRNWIESVHEAGLKFIEDIRDMYEGEEIWVVGAGPSLDKYPLSFFQDRVCVGVNWVFSVFVDIGDREKKFGTRAFYSVHEHREPADWIVRNIPWFLKNCFFLLPSHRRPRMVWWEDYNADPYYMRWGRAGKSWVAATDEDFERVAKCIVDKEGMCHYVCRNTTLHWGIQAAAVLGAKKIFLVGAEAQGGYMHRHGSLYAAGGGPWNHAPSQWHAGTRSLAKAFESHGIEIVYYYYGKGEQS